MASVAMAIAMIKQRSHRMKVAMWERVFATSSMTKLRHLKNGGRLREGGSWTYGVSAAPSSSHPRLVSGTLSLFIRLAFLLLIVDGDDDEVCEPEEAVPWFGRSGRLGAGGCV